MKDSCVAIGRRIVPIRSRSMMRSGGTLLDALEQDIDVAALVGR
jgi:hypothetical protein